jgi:hypothetical protein
MQINKSKSWIKASLRLAGTVATDYDGVLSFEPAISQEGRNRDRTGWRVTPNRAGQEICARSPGRFRPTPVGSDCRRPPYA